MFAKATKNRFLAVFAVLMLMICSVAVVADADASPYGGVTKNEGTETAQKFTVQMSVGQTFTYSGIATNLENYGTIDLDWSGTAKEAGIALTDRTLSGKFSNAGTYEGVLKASWTGADAGTDGKKPTQTATQTITFKVDEKITIATTTTAYALVGMDSSKTVLTLSCGGSTGYTQTGSEVINATYAYGTDKHTNNDTSFTASYDASTKKITVTPSKKLADTDVTIAEPQKIYVTLTNPNTEDTQTGEIILYIYDEIAITSTTTHYYTYEGDTTYSATGFVFSVNYDDDNNAETVVDEKSMKFTVGGTESTDQTVLAQDSENYKKVIIKTPYTKAGALTNDGTSLDYTATLTVNGHVTPAEGGNEMKSNASQIFTLTVYKALAFTTEPAVSNVTAKAVSTGSNNTMTLSANLSGAKYVTINWGDGQSSNRTAISDVSSLYNAKHTYASSGMYLITITAENDVGTTTSKVMYGVNTSVDPTPGTDTTTSDSKDKGFFEEHGYLFLVFLLILVGLLVAYFYFGIQHPFVLLAAIVCAVLAIALFVYGDFGGIADALKGSK